MVDLSVCEEASFNLVYSDQPIEPVPGSVGEKVLPGATRALRPGG